MHLHIDTSNNLKTIVKLNQKTVVVEYQSPRDQNVLSAIATALTQTNSTWSDITSVSFEKGPGSFTGLRVGACIINALNFSLGLIKHPSRHISLPTYGKPPSITLPKKPK